MSNRDDNEPGWLFYIIAIGVIWFFFIKDDAPDVESSYDNYYDGYDDAVAECKRTHKCN